VLARPCHGTLGRFVQKALEGSVSEVLIFTRPSTIEADAGSFFPKLERIEAPGLLPAADGEEIACYRYERKWRDDDLWEEYEVLDAAGAPIDTMWAQRISRREERYQNVAGGTGTLDGLARRLAGSRARAGKRLRSAGSHWRTVPTLPVRPGYVQDDGEKYHGWVGPTGLLFTCEYFEHDPIVYDVMHLTTEEAGLMGWRRTVMPLSFDEDVEIILSNRSNADQDLPTTAQLVVLEELNRRYKCRKE
jgi:hypothetical protein